VQSAEGREVTYNPARLSGVNVYWESNRTFSEGDRIQFRAPFTEQRVANGEIGTIAHVEDEKFMVALDSGRESAIYILREHTDPVHNPMIPHTLVLEPGLLIYKIYMGYWSSDGRWWKRLACRSQEVPDGLGHHNART
jgi:hypothetical protein